MAIESLHRVSETDVSNRFGFYYREAMTHPVAVERDGVARVVMMPAAEYERLARFDHVALHPRELHQGDLDALRDILIPESARSLDHLLD